ncbi:MAG: GNAT family N-acetyltransferase [Theionarchaea archaeon]|nr:GNAT family N-acetyltransferase [Theionarchaea archaeon]
MEVHITNTIQDIDEKEWNALINTDHIEQSHAWYRAVEDSRMRKMYYIFVQRGARTVAAACCYPFTQKLYVEVPFLDVTTPLGTSIAFFSKTPEDSRVLIQGLEEIQKREKTKGFLILDLKKDELIFFRKHMKGVTPFPLCDNTYLNLNYTDFEDYLSSLDAKARRSIRITLNRAQKRFAVTSLFTHNLSQWASTARSLQEYTCKDHNNYQTFLTEEFYSAVEAHLKEKAELLFLFKDDIPLAFAVILNTSDFAHYKFPGIDPHYREYQAYFLLYYEGIRRAIEKKQKRIYFGSTTYEFKEKIGCQREKLFGLAKMTNPLLNQGLKSFIALSRLFNKHF